MARVDTVYVAVRGDAGVVALMGGIRGSLGGSLSMLLVGRLLVSPGGFGMAILVAVEMWVRHHLERRYQCFCL